MLFAMPAPMLAAAQLAEEAAEEAAVLALEVSKAAVVAAVAAAWRAELRLRRRRALPHLPEARSERPARWQMARAPARAHLRLRGVQRQTELLPHLPETRRSAGALRRQRNSHVHLRLRGVFQSTAHT